MTYLYDISIPLKFDGPQPNAFGVEPASSRACEYGDLIGDTRRGGSCNFERVTFIPHCNGTHTECVGHITDERISVRDCLRDVFVSALLVTVEPRTVGGDLVITREDLETAIGARSAAALIIRTLPNGDDKLSARYDNDHMPPYFEADAMRSIVSRGFDHLVTDLPSVDRLFDEGRLENHRIFWRVEAGSRKIGPDSRINSTITELAYISDEVVDGEYMLNLQIAPFESDAAPSRPVLFRPQHAQERFLIPGT